MPGWVREGINPSPTLEPCFWLFLNQTLMPGAAPPKGEKKLPHPSIPSRDGEGK